MVGKAQETPASWAWLSRGGFCLFRCYHADMIRWERLALVRTPLIMILAFACIAIGVFMFSVPAGWITVGVMGIFLAYVTDPEAIRGGQGR